MAYKSKILAFAASTRGGSYNKMLLANAVGFAENAGASVTVADLRQFPMPLYDADLEMTKGIPEHAVRFKKLMIENDGFLIASPEYNAYFTPLMKNTIDWASRTREGEPPFSGFEGKVAALIAASPGALGGVRGLFHLRALLANMRVLVIPDQKAVPHAHKAFGAGGALIDDGTREAVTQLTTALVRMITKLHS
jgi:chromate reductase